MAGARILIVDDDPQIREVLRIALEREGFAVRTAGDGAAGLVAAGRDAPDLVVLDVGLPEMDGLEVCRRLRRTSAVPVLFLSARAEEVDRIVGLELGADDYLGKPFSPRELVARVKAILKRGRAEEDGPMVQGLLHLDRARHLVAVAGIPVALTTSEIGLLARLMARPDHVATRAALHQALYGQNLQASDRTLDSHLRNLRRKLAEAGCGDALETVHGVGIRLGPCLGG